MNKLTEPRSPLGRPLDPTYLSNVLAVGAGLATALLFGLVEAFTSLSLASPWWVAAGAVFLTWAIARELDPDHAISAAAAMAVMAVVAAFVQPSLLFAFGALTGVRLVAGTVGLDPTPADFWWALGIGGLMGIGAPSLAAAVLLALGIATIGRYSRRSLWFAAGAVVLAMMVFAVTGAALTWSALDGWAIALIAAVAIATALSVPAPQPEVSCDVGNRRIEGRNVNVARWAALGGVALSLAVDGGSGVAAAATLAVAPVGVALVGILKPIGARMGGARLHAGSSS